jgi:tetratricopeptide (TPR) repeat protein
MAEEGQLRKDKIAAHAERNNLSMYCGIMKAFRPAVSKKIKLKDMDVFSLFTRGIWENTRNIDMLSAVQTAGNDPQAAVSEAERIILDKTATEASTENYTVCFVFVDKVFIDPDEKKRRKRIIIISVIAFLVIVIVIAAVIIFNRWRRRTENDMRLAYHNGIEYIQAGNFIRAREELDTAYGLAGKLWDEKHKSDINNHKLLVDAVVRADDLLAAKDYDAAVEAYNAAENQSRYADNLSIEYIEDRREKAGELADVHGFIMLGDTLADTGDWDNAEEKYLEARRLASRLSYADGKTEADTALDALYGKRQQEIDAQKEQAQAVTAAAELIIEGDKALRGGDLVGAAALYTLAREEYEKLGNEAVLAVIDEKMALVDIQAAQDGYQLEYAADYVQAGDEMAEAGEYIDAKRLYLLAREIYANLGEEDRMKEVGAKIELVDIYLTAAPTATNEAVNQ